MAEVILTTNIKREKGYLYFVSTNSEGNLVVNKALMARGKGKKAEVQQ